MTFPTRYAVLVSSLAAILPSAALWSATQVAAPPNHGLTVPDGFEVELVAGPPLVNRPIVADFDERGRLYVADSSGSNDKVEQQLAERPHRIVRLEDANGDGRFDKSVVFADKMMFPEGTMWYDGSLYVAAPPSIWKLTDTDGDGVADQREEWFQGKTLTGCANDLHGPYLGIDGWIYWTKGAFAQQTYERPGKAPLVTRASHIFRRRPGDPAIEPVMTGGMDNPVDVAFTPTGERILTATFLEHPQLGRRDAIIHAVYGGLYGKPHAVLDGHKRTGDLMPVMAQLGPAVPSGLTRYASRVFGEAYRDNFFATMFNMHKVTRNVLEPSGATFSPRSSDFLVSNSRDFHPTDVLEDADGSLLVVDTGPWYKLCCPTSQLAKPDVLGAIYRVRRRGASQVADPRGQRIQWTSMEAGALVKFLADQRPAVVNRALYHFGRQGSAAVQALAGVLGNGRASVEARRNAVWALARIEHPQARDAGRSALSDGDESVRRAAIYSAGLWRDRAAVSQVMDRLQSPAPAERRVAAEALGRIGDSRAVPELMRVVASGGDRVLEHSLTYALIEIADRAATLTHALPSASPRVRRAALIAVDQMDGGGLDPASIVPLLNSPDVLLKDTAWWIAGNHPDWGGALATFFRDRLTAADLAPADREDLQRKLAQFGENAAIQELLASLVGGAPTPGARLAALTAMTSAGVRLKTLPQSWIAPLVTALTRGEEADARQAIAVARSSRTSKEPVPEVQQALLQLAREHRRGVDLRVEAVAAMQEGLTTLEGDLFDVLRQGLEPSQPTVVRSAAAGVLERMSLTRDQLLTLARSVAEAGPLELPRLIAPFEREADEAVGQALIAALEQSKGRASLRADRLRAALAKYPQPVQQRGEGILAAAYADSAQQAKRLEQLLGTLGEGDVRRGQQIFNSQKAACYSCHAIGYMGGRVGPDLTRIGQVRSERDLLEAIVFPSASFARSYEPFTVRRRSGATESGMLRSDLPDEIVLGTVAGEEIRIPRTDVADLEPSAISLMPSGLDAQLTRQELADLMAFLKATRPGAN